MKKMLILAAAAFLASSCSRSVSMDMKKDYQNIRHSAVSGSFYPDKENALRSEVDKFIGRVILSDRADGPRDKEAAAVIVPHAGYGYSGQTAAYAYKVLKNRFVRTVFLVGSAHSSAFSGVALDDSDAWETPLGLVEVDLKKAEAVSGADNSFIFDKKAHIADHVLEVQLPFLQAVLRPGFKIAPILIGSERRSNDELSAAISKAMGPQDILVISSDLSHYPEYFDANSIDKKTLEKIADLDEDGLKRHVDEIMASGIPGQKTCACGLDAVLTVMNLACKNEWQAEILNYSNSGDALFGSKDEVVGYGAMVFWQSRKNMDILSDEQKKDLKDIARKSVEFYVKTGNKPVFTVYDERLNLNEGAFVTLKSGGLLRGCIGRVLPGKEPLYEVVRDMAIAAASDDPRFSPIGEEELEGIEYEISVLSPPRPIDDWRDIELGRHGVIIKKGFRSGLFLPQVADDTGWSKEEFLSELCENKAGLPPDAYKTDPKAEISVFTAQVF